MRAGLLFLLVLTLAVASGCATTRAGRRTADPVDVVLAEAERLLGQSSVTVSGRSHRADCSGFVCAVFGSTSQELIDPEVGGRSGTELIWNTMRSRGRIVPTKKLARGDLVFFHNTYDRNGNGLRDDRFTHVGVVATVARDGSARFLHFASGKVSEGHIHPGRPNQVTDPVTGVQWNSALRRGAGRRLAGQLVFGAARPLQKRPPPSARSPEGR